MKEEHLVDKVLHKLVKKHIAGTNMSSAIEKAKELNGKGVPVSLTFLSDVPRDRSKAKYITSTYLELIRQAARLHLKASVQVPLEQIGSTIARDAVLANMKDIVAAGNRYGIFLWFEADEGNMDIAEELGPARGCGISADISTAKAYVKRHKRVNMIKVRCGKPHAEKAGKKSPDEIGEIEEIAKRSGSTMLTHMHDGVPNAFLKNGSKYRKSLIFEFQLGYSGKKMSRITKRGGRLSVCVPFGKDWARYAMNTVPEGYIRFLASNLLNEADSNTSV